MSKFTTVLLLLSLTFSLVSAESPSARAHRMKRGMKPRRASCQPRNAEGEIASVPGPRPTTAAAAAKFNGPVPVVEHGGRQFNVVKMYEGDNFFDGFNFFDKEDPTHGMVNYLPREAAMGAGLAKVVDGVAVIAVDDTTDLPDDPSTRRNSVRLESKDKYDGGLVIADFAAMPVGCSTWPAWWTVGPEWPKGGEIDILEGVNNMPVNQYTLHTTEGCSAQYGANMEGNILKADCDVTGNKGNAGCGIQDSDPRSYGHGFNGAGGGVFAHLWDKDGIKIWHFARGEIPEDITSRNPNPSAWPKPTAFFPETSCSSTHFYQHQLVLNISLCGDWAGNAFASSGCAGTCSAVVAKGENFKNAKFKVNYIGVWN